MVSRTRHARALDAPEKDEVNLPDPADNQDRRSRKRQTDRLAQQQHRKRQKLYVEQLEEKLRVLQSTDQSEVIRLGNQNLQLRQELESFHSLHKEMEDLLQRQRELVKSSALGRLPPISQIGPPITASYRSPQSPASDSFSQNKDNEQLVSLENEDMEAEASPSHQPTPPALLPASQPQLQITSAFEVGTSETARVHGASQTSSGGTGFDRKGDAGLDRSEDAGDGNYGLDAENNRTGFTPHVGENIETGCEVSVSQDIHFMDDALQFCIGSGYLENSLNLSNDSQLPQAHQGWSYSSNVATGPHAQYHGHPLLSVLPFGGIDLSGTGLCNTASTADNPFGGFQEAERHYQAKPGYLRDGDYAAAPKGLHFEYDSSRPSVGRISGNFSTVFSNPWTASKLPSPSFPVFLSPPLKEDEPINRIIERARSSSKPVKPPSIMDFLLDSPENTLSTDLKTFLEPVKKTRRTAEFLATYWVLYLLLRWYVNQDEESYLGLPAWLRPSPLQLTVAHPVGAGLIAWPEMRQQVILMSQVDAHLPEEVSSEIGRHLTVSIDASKQDLCNDPSRIASEITNIANWKLGEGFYEVYPRLRGLINV